jgi:hypothetical protein
VATVIFVGRIAMLPLLGTEFVPKSDASGVLLYGRFGGVAGALKSCKPFWAITLACIALVAIVLIVIYQNLAKNFLAHV